MSKQVYTREEVKMILRKVLEEGFGDRESTGEFERSFVTDSKMK